jgi:hypothetical protein
MNRLGIALMISAAIMIFIGYSGSFSNLSNFEKEEENLKIRMIAHRLLQYAGDSSSPLPNIKNTSPDSYKITFNRQFSFLPDSVVQVIGKVLNANSPDYLVKVIDPNKEETVFGFAILNSMQTDIVPCKGRQQSSQPYQVDILFRRKAAILPIVLKIIGLIFLIAGLLVFKKNIRRKTKAPIIQSSPQLAEHPLTYQLGAYQLDLGNRTLQIEDQTIELTNKEVQLLSLFAQQPNTVIERSRLLKEVWQDEGVMVSRSLDMFISKIRKKLEGDASLQLRNVHGKGYGLFIG